MKLELMPLDWKPIFFLSVVIVFVVMVGLLPRLQGGGGGGWKSWLALVFVLPVIAAGLLMMFLLFFRRGIEIQGQTVSLNSVFYSIEFQKQDVADIRPLPDGEAPALGLRTNGISMPGLNSGWFMGERNRFFVDFVNRPNVLIRLKNGRPAVLVELKDPHDIGLLTRPDPAP